MADNHWKDENGDYADSINWSLAATAPDAGDGVRLPSGSKTITTNIPGATAGVAYESFKVTRDFAGKIAAAGEPLHLGTLTGDFIYDAPRCLAAHFAADRDDTIAVAVIKATILGGVGLNIEDSGAGAGAAGVWTDFVVKQCGNLTIKTGVDITRLHVLADLGPTSVTLETGAEPVTVYQAGGIIHNETELASGASWLYLSGGTFWHEGGTEFDIDNVVIGPAARFMLHSNGGTLTNVWNIGGVIDADGGTGLPRTITNLWNLGGLVNLKGLGSSVVVTNTKADYGEIRR